MRTIRRYMLSISAAAALLAGCDGRQPPIGAPGALPQSRVIAARAEGGGSWMLPAATRANLLYVSAGGYVFILSYPAGKLVGSLAGLNNPGRLCSDSTGNVWVTTGSGSGPGALVEYAHGGTAPIQTLFDPSAPMDCSVDHVTGNLAVANGCFSGSCGSNLAIFRHASGSPAIYPLPAPDGPPYSCTYDAAGNVFIAAYEDVYKTGTLWLPKGGTALSRFLLVPRPYPHAGLQWDGTRLAIEISDTEIYQYKLRPHSGHRRHATFLQDGAGRRFWIQGNILVGGSNGVFLWRYPAGGAPIKTLTLSGSKLVYGVTVSLGKR